MANLAKCLTRVNREWATKDMAPLKQCKLMFIIVNEVYNFFRQGVYCIFTLVWDNVHLVIFIVHCNFSYVQWLFLMRLMSMFISFVTYQFSPLMLLSYVLYYIFITIYSTVIHNTWSALYIILLFDVNVFMFIL